MNIKGVDKNWADYAEKHLVGRTINQVRYMSKEETNDCLNWSHRPLVIHLDDGTIFIYKFIAFPIDKQSM
jgi:hypothetical protein